MDDETLTMLKDLGEGNSPRNHHITRRIPAEVWEVIFQKLQPSYSYCGTLAGPADHYAWLSLLRVCRFFNTVTLRIPSLWTRIHLTPETLGITERVLKRAGSDELLLAISGFSAFRWPIPHRQFVKSIAPRIHTLVLIDSLIGTITDLGSLPVLTTLIHRSESLAHDFYFPKIECPVLRIASFQPPLMKTVINHLSNLTSLFIGSPIQDPSIRLSPTMITGLLREHPLLEELIFVRVFIIKEPSNPPKIPHPLYNLKRLAFYHCESAAIQTIVAAIPHTYGLSIVVNTVADWGKYVKLSAARSLIAKTVPRGRDGYTDAFISGFTTKSMQINLSGPGVAYSIVIPAEHWTAHTILHGLADSGHFAHLQRLCVRGLAYTVLEADWLRSASNLSFLTVQCTMVMWHRPRWMERLFESLPSSLGELQILVCPDEDIGIAKNNCQRLLALNRERMRPLHIYLKIYDALFRKKSTFVIYDHFRNEDRHVSVEPWDLYQTHRELLGEHLHNECDISPHHKYWPSWFEEDFTYCPVRHHDGLDDYMW